MFNISLDGGSFSKNLDDFDSIRSVLLYRSVKPIPRRDDYQDLIYSFNCIFCEVVLFGQRPEGLWIPEGI